MSFCICVCVEGRTHTQTHTPLLVTKEGGHQPGHWPRLFCLCPQNTHTHTLTHIFFVLNCYWSVGSSLLLLLPKTNTWTLPTRPPMSVTMATTGGFSTMNKYTISTRLSSAHPAPSMTSNDPPTELIGLSLRLWSN